MGGGMGVLHHLRESQAVASETGRIHLAQRR